MNEILKSALEDKRLNSNAFRVLAYAINKGDSITVAEVREKLNMGDSATRTVLNQLNDAEYVVKHRNRRTNGTFEGVKWIVNKPQVDNNQMEETQAVEPHTDEPQVDKEQDLAMRRREFFKELKSTNRVIQVAPEGEARVVDQQVDD